MHDMAHGLVRNPLRPHGRIARKEMWQDEISQLPDMIGTSKSLAVLLVFQDGIWRFGTIATEQACIICPCFARRK
jgi:hypothetical protein